MVIHLFFARRATEINGFAELADTSTHVSARARSSNFVISLGGLPLMMSAKISDFLTPSPPCPQINATSLTKVAFYVCF